MRKFFTLTLLACLFNVVAFAKIWRVNNNIGITANFTNLQEAHNGAASGDTIYLESSPTSYGGLTSTKKLTVIGTGYFLDVNPDLQAFTLPSKVDAITLNAGSSGSTYEGLSFNSSALNIYVSDVVVRRNNFGSFNGNDPIYSNGTVGLYAAISNVIITQNFGVIINNNNPCTGILITNNFLSFHSYYGEATNQNCVQLHTSTVAIIKNNIIRRGTLLAYNSNITNNIIYNGFYGGSGNLVSNNIGNSTQFGTADGNQSSVDMATVFVSTGSYDNYFKLKTGSPAIGAGYGSTAQTPVDAGIFGGSTPYVLSGIPAIPSIYYFKNQPVGSNSDPIDVQVKVRSNN